jgi:hypothetical protein
MREAIVSKNRRINANFALLTMFHSVLKCVAYARSRRSISFWYLSIENAGGWKRSSECSSAKRPYIVSINAWISATARAPWSKSARIVPKKSFIALRIPRVNGLASMRRRVRPAFILSASWRLQSKTFFVLLGDQIPERGVAVQPALEQRFLVGDALHHVRDDILVLAAQRAAARRLSATPSRRASSVARAPWTIARTSVRIARRRSRACAESRMRQRGLEDADATLREQARRRR